MKYVLQTSTFGEDFKMLLWTLILLCGKSLIDMLNLDVCFKSGENIRGS